MVIFNYKKKADLKAAVGQPLAFRETSVFGPEYRRDGKVLGCPPKRNWFAEVTMVAGKIAKVT
jgi:hypothetical protein